MAASYNSCLDYNRALNQNPEQVARRLRKRMKDLLNDPT